MAWDSGIAIVVAAFHVAVHVKWAIFTFQDRGRLLACLLLTSNEYFSGPLRLVGNPWSVDLGFGERPRLNGNRCDDDQYEASKDS